MNVSIYSVGFSATEKLKNFINKKITKLYKIDEKIIKTDIHLKLEKSETLRNKITEITLILPGNDIFSKKNAKTFEESTDMAVEALRKQLKKRKDKIRRK